MPLTRTRALRLVPVLTALLARARVPLLRCVRMLRFLLRRLLHSARHARRNVSINDVLAYYA